MNGFLARLVERASGTGPLLRPVLPSKFETVPPDKAPVLMPPIAQTGPKPEATPKADQSLDRTSAPGQTPANVAVPQVMPDKRPTAPEGPPRYVEGRDMHSDIDTIGISPPDTARSAADRHDPTRPIPVTPAISKPGRKAEGLDAPFIKASPPIPVSRTIHPATIPRPGDASAMPGQRRPAVGGVARIDATLPSVPVRTQRPDNARLRSDAEAARPEPSVHVTIGRIEVRALMQPSPPSKTNPPPRPKLSLDDYLKQRDGGKP